MGTFEAVSITVSIERVESGHRQQLGGQMSSRDPNPPCSTEPALGGVIKFRNCKILRGGSIVDDDLWVKDGTVIDPAARFWEAMRGDDAKAADVVVDCKGLLIAPGFLDVQLNGAFGVDFTNPELTAEQVQTVSEGILRHGVTSYCPTVVTSSPDVYNNVLPMLGPAEGSPSSACILGAHLEGPYISEHKYGAHDINLIRSPTDGFSSLDECYGPSLQKCARIVTLAPELPGAIAAVEGLAGHGIVASLGHSACDLGTASQAVSAGATMITHLFNAMQPFHHRDPGLIGLLGSDSPEATDDAADAADTTKCDVPGVSYGIIADGVHCHPASVRIAYNACPKGAVLVTDAMMAMGLPPGFYPLGTMKVEITDRAHIAGTKILAGAIAPMDVCVRNFIKFTGCTVIEALEAASLHPAQVVGVAPRKGTLDFGADADLIFLDDELKVQGCYVNGEYAWSNLDQL